MSTLFLILTKFRNDWAKIVDFLLSISIYLSKSTFSFTCLFCYFHEERNMRGLSFY